MTASIVLAAAAQSKPQARQQSFLRWRSVRGALVANAMLCFLLCPMCGRWLPHRCRNHSHALFQASMACAVSRFCSSSQPTVISLSVPRQSCSSTVFVRQQHSLIWTGAI